MERERMRETEREREVSQHFRWLQAIHNVLIAIDYNSMSAYRSAIDCINIFSLSESWLILSVRTNQDR